MALPFFGIKIPLKKKESLCRIDGGYGGNTHMQLPINIDL